MMKKIRHIRQRLIRRILRRKARSRNTARPPRDPREIITPTAFRIEESLLGHPLAAPWKRLLAIGIDSILGYLFAGLGTVSVALASGFFIAYLPVRKRRNLGKPVGRFRTILALTLGIVTIALILGSVSLGKNLLHEADQQKSAGARTTLETAQPENVSVAVPDSPSTDKALVLLAGENAKLKRQLAEYQNQTVSLKDRLLGLAGDFGLSFGWFGLYTIIALTLWNGWTPGKRLLGIRVVRLSGQPMTLWSSFERFGGYAAGTFTGLLGFLQIFWDSNRQGIQDKIGSTVVIDVRKARRVSSAPKTAS
jgi:hypothetical protein